MLASSAAEGFKRPLRFKPDGRCVRKDRVGEGPSGQQIEPAVGESVIAFGRYPFRERQLCHNQVPAKSFAALSSWFHLSQT